MNELKILKELKLKQPKGIRRFIFEKTDYQTNKTQKVSRYVSTIELWRGKLLKRTFAFICANKDKTFRNMQIKEVCRCLEGYKGCLLSGVESHLGGKTVFYNDDVFWINDTRWNFWEYDMFSKDEIINRYDFLKYCQWDLAEGNVNMNFFDYICAYHQCPKIELLVKAGLTQFVHCYKKLNMKAKSLDTIFGLNNYWIKHLKGLTYGDIMLIKNKKRKIKKLDDLIKIKKTTITPIANGWFNGRRCKYINKYMNVKMFDYLQKIERNNVCIYDDYLDMCERLEYDMTDDRVLFPNNLNTEHNSLTKLVKIKKDKETKDKFIDAYIDLCRYIYSSGNFIIIPPKKVEELEEESKELHHCVKMYADRHANKETKIMFVREVNHVTKPYATLEFDGKRIIQFRAKHNKLPEQSAIDFIKKWESKFGFVGW